MCIQSDKSLSTDDPPMSEGRTQESPKGEKTSLPSSGILPISQSGFQTEFSLVGSGEPHDDCGEFFTVGCLNVEEHKGMNLDGVDMSNKVYLERRKKSCHRPICRVCWHDWANREMRVASNRLRSFGLKGRSLKPIHLIVSVPNADYGLSLEQMRKKVYRSLKEVHCLGGMMIFHPKRQNSHVWYFSPHFHVIGYGWIVDVRRNYFVSGYVVKNVGIRKTVEGTIWYQLSHCGVDYRFHAVTWFGCLSYSKLRVKIEKEEHLCPICGQKLIRLIWCGVGTCNIPDVEAGGWFDSPENWTYYPSRFKSDDF